jgi:hypothetical protein
MLTLSNDDPGLGGSVCSAGGSLPATSATLYIGLDYGATRNAGWENDILPWPQPLVNVLEGDLPVEQMPCGPGGYARFQTGGMPYIAWAGFGSVVSAANRQAIIDAFNGIRVSDGEIAAPTTEMPGYVLTGGTTDSGSAWTIEVSPSARNVDMSYSEVGNSGSGAGDFTVPDVPIEASAGHPVVFGAVTFDADRVEVRPSDGSDPLPGTILQLPDSLGAPFDAFVAPNSPDGKVVAIGPEGELGSAATTAVDPEPAPTESSVDLKGFSSPARLTVRKDTANGCLSIEIAIGDNEGAGTCGGGSLGPLSAYMFEQQPGMDVILGYATPEADQVYLVSDDGQRFDAPILYTLRVEPSVQFFAFSVPATSGRLHVTDVNGVPLSSPLSLNSAP